MHIGGVASGRVCTCSLRNRLVSIDVRLQLLLNFHYIKEAKDRQADHFLGLLFQEGVDSNTRHGSGCLVFGAGGPMMTTSVYERTCPVHKGLREPVLCAPAAPTTRGQAPLGEVSQLFQSGTKWPPWAPRSSS